jgi:hypothetical protein
VCDATQDGYLGCGGCCAAYGSAPSFRPNLHYFRRSGAQDLSTGLLRKQDLLRGFTKELDTDFSTSCQERVGV